ncbi:MAG: DUF2157 domain-containing protein [Deltaproteobacteria bacterium]|nr:DUF2157 domain-containing protein [Deltaproteobacteria bacterium]
MQGGLLGPEQADRILALYPLAPPPARRSLAARVPAILIAIAVLLIGVGLILFYAANWRRMPPGLKLVQVFLLLALTYGGSYLLLFSRRVHPLAGRGLLLLGMLSFGAAIGLVAQIFHISAHPTNGVLAWLLGTLALAVVMDERWGYYLAALLALVWNCWELFQYANPNYLFVLFPAALFYLFARKGDAIGVLAAAVELLFFFYQVNGYWLAHLPTRTDAGGFAFLVLHLPFGVLLLCLARLCARPALRLAAWLFGVCGWLALFAPLIGLSWPLKLDFVTWFDQRPVLRLVVELVALTAVAGGLVHLLRRRGHDLRLLLAGLGYGLLLLVAPVGRKPVLLVLTHLGLVGLLLGALSYSHRPGGWRLDRFLAYFLALATLAVKGIGLFAMGMTHREYYVAYCLGFVVLATVIFLVSQQARHWLGRVADAARYRAALLDGAAALAIFLMLYAVSFKVPEQRSIFSAEPVVVTLIVLFMALAVGFYAALWLRGAARLPLVLSAAVFVIAAAVIFAAGPRVPWEVYSAVFNVLLFVVDGVLIYYSTRVNSAALANVTIGALVLQIATRYFDLFWDLLSGSLLFIATGILVFGGGFALERLRRRVVREARKPAGGEGAGGAPGVAP